MSTNLWGPWQFGLPHSGAIAVPSPGGTLYRLVKNDPPKRSDFKAINEAYADRMDFPELSRVALSHYLTADQAETWAWDPKQHIAAVTLPASPRIHLARTDKDRPGHAIELSHAQGRLVSSW